MRFISFIGSVCILCHGKIISSSLRNTPGTNETGLPYNVTGGTPNLELRFNGYGETASQDTDVDGYEIYSWSVTDRYPDEKIKTKTETINGGTTEFEYTHDEMGRLTTVAKDGTIVEEYTYDQLPYGTLTYQVDTEKGINGRTLEYDDEDRLLSARDVQYQYDRYGFLESRSTPEGTTYYNYSCRSELLSVELPDNTLLEYISIPPWAATLQKRSTAP